MAALGLIESELQGISDVKDRAVLLRIFRYVLKELRVGHPTGMVPDPAENFSAAFLTGTTASVANNEFTLPHGFGRVPYLAFGVLPLDQEGAQLVPLTVTRVADNKRIYLSSSVTDAPVTIYVES